jgi:nucleotide-binding universal stress UspA family protein
MTSCLVVANRTMGGRKLEQYLHQLVAERGPVQFHFVVPERRVEAYELMWGAGWGVPMSIGTLMEAGLRETQARLDEVVELLRGNGLDVTGELGPAPPLAAIAQALDERQYDEIVISTLPVGISKWLTMDLPRRVIRRFGLPVTTIVHDVGDASLVDLSTPTTAGTPDESIARSTLRATAVEHPIQVLAVNTESLPMRRAQVALEQTGLCCIHRTRDVAEAVAFLRGEGRFAGRALPDLIVVPVEGHQSAPESLTELADEIERYGRALLVVGDADSDSNRRLADAAHAWAFVPLTDDNPDNAEVLELMLVELMALEHKREIIKP